MTDLVSKLCRQSVAKHYDAYADVDWDAPEMRVDPDDPRWELGGDDDPLAETAWYRALPPEARSRLGLHMVASQMKIGLQFENILQRGLLGLAARLPDGAPEFRYAYHEVIEEAQHTLMFQEFVNRAGFPVGGLGPALRFFARRVVNLGERFPELFFVFVLSGEDPIDHVQRRALARDQGLHPLLRRIMQIHVTEEARHLTFARHYLRTRVPHLSPWRRLRLRLGTPFILGMMSRLMMEPSREVVSTHHIPPRVVREAYARNQRHRAAVSSALTQVRTLCRELDLVAPPLWRLAGLSVD